MPTFRHYFRITSYCRRFSHSEMYRLRRRDGVSVGPDSRRKLAPYKSFAHLLTCLLNSNWRYLEEASDLQDFLRSCNPRQQHSVTFESYLIKPIQRILKYPLLLRQLMELTEAYTDEHRHLAGARTQICFLAVRSIRPQLTVVQCRDKGCCSTRARSFRGAAIGGSGKSLCAVYNWNL